MRSLTVQSPAKINLYLKILNRRPDGYHNLLTLFHRISLKDSLRLTKIPKGFSLNCSNKKLAIGEDNLITRAYRLLQKKFPKIGGVSVYLRKHIPIGGGLGGGSSNAAAFLRGMKKLYGLALSQKKLIGLGKSLGADVPFFLYGVNQAIGKGRGDQVLLKPFQKSHWFLLLVSNKGVSTKRVYESLPKRFPAVSLTKVTRAVTILSDFLDRRNYSQAAGWLKNDLEQPAFHLRPSIQKVVAKLKKLGVKAAMMSGSGPTVFAILSRRQEAKRLAQKLRNKKFSERIIICHSF